MTATYKITKATKITTNTWLFVIFVSIVVFMSAFAPKALGRDLAGARVPSFAGGGGPERVPSAVLRLISLHPERHQAALFDAARSDGQLDHVVAARERRHRQLDDQRAGHHAFGERYVDSQRPAVAIEHAGGAPIERLLHRPLDPEPLLARERESSCGLECRAAPPAQRLRMVDERRHGLARRRGSAIERPQRDLDGLGYRLRRHRGRAAADDRVDLRLRRRAILTPRAN